MTGVQNTAENLNSKETIAKMEERKKTQEQLENHFGAKKLPGFL